MAYFNGTNAPTITLEMQLVTTWTAVTTTDVKSISVRRGRTREDQNYQPGTLTVILDNTSGEYNPDNQTNSYFIGGRTYLDAHTAIRLKATWDSTDYIIYNGFIEDVQVDVSLAPITTIIATDALAFFGRTKLALPALTTTQTVHNRINTILGNFNVSWTAKDIGTGTRNIVVQDESKDVLSLLEEAAACEFGRFWIDREGTAYFRSWDELPTMPFGISLTDLHNLTTVEYDVINTEPGSRYRINSVTVDGNNSSTASGSDSDSTSISDYGLFEKQYSLPLSTNTDCAALATQIVGRFAFPATRINHVEFEAVGMELLWDKILTLDLNYLVNVDRTTVDNFEMKIGGFIEGLNFDITPESWRYQLELSDFAYTDLTPSFVAAKSDGTSYYSSDGTTWTSIGTTLDMSNAIYGTDKYVEADTRGTAYYSSDATTWTSATLPGTGTITPQGITYGDGKFIINDYYGDRVWYSADGITWTEVSLSYVSGNVSAYINYVDNEYIMTNSTFNVMKSTNGTTWTTASYAPNSQFFSKLNGNYVSVYYTNSYFIKSTDKTTWSSDINTLITNTRRMAYGGGVYVAVGQGGISYSSNLTSWTLSGTTGVQVYAVTYGNGQFVAASANGILTSTDGNTWTQVLSGDFREVYCKDYQES